MTVTEWLGSVGAVVGETARKMGEGEGFWITFSTYIAMVLVERGAYLLHDAGRPYDNREAGANIVNQLVTLAAEALVFGALFMATYTWLYEHARVTTIPFEWWGWVLALLLNDLAYYVDHRIAHRTGFFWAAHVPHHSSQEMNLLVASRGSVFSLAGLLSPVFLLLPVLGLHPAMFLAAKFFGNLWGIFNHTRLVKRMGVLDRWLCTPSNHRVHHGVELKYLDKNYGQTLLLWDRLFGTWQREEEEPTYGLVSQMNSHKVWDIQTWGVRWLMQQMAAAPRWSDKLRYLIKPPGWRHDGQHQTTEALRAAVASPARGRANVPDRALNETRANMSAAERTDRRHA